MEYRYTGIILGKYDVGETDRIYSIYTKEIGKIRVLAAGVRKSQAKLAGQLETLMQVEIFIAKSRGMGKITSAVAENSFLELRKNLEALGSAFTGIKFLEKLVDFEEKDERIFELTKGFLAVLDELAGKVELEKNLPLLGVAYKIKLLDLLGYRIGADTCTKCANRLSSTGNFFSAQAGGFICQKCCREFSDKIRTETDAIKIVRIIMASSLQSLVKLQTGEGNVKSVAIMVEAFANWTKC